MGTCVVFQWAKAVLSPQFLSLIPSDVDRATLLSDVTAGLQLTADLSSDMDSPALQGQWEDILCAQIKLIDLLTKWQANSKKNSLSSVHSNNNNNNTNHIVYSNSDSKVPKDLDDSVSEFSQNNSTDNCLLSASKPENLQETSVELEKNISLSDDNSDGRKLEQDVHSVFVLSDDCSQLNIIPSLTCTVPSAMQQPSSSDEQRVDHVTMSVNNNSQVILVTTGAVVKTDAKTDTAKIEKKQEELYMNIVLASGKNFNARSKEVKKKEEKLKSEKKENPLDKLCQLLRIDEEEIANEVTEEKCVEFERRRRYEENMPFKYFCSNCSFKTKRENQFLKHIKLHEKHKVIYHCNHCQFSTIRVSTLRRHELQHNEGHLLNCPHCPYETDSLKFLRRHVQAKHSTDKPNFQCCQCNFVGGSMRELKSHSHVHNQIKPKMFWNCNLCAYKTQNKGHLQRHTNDVHKLMRPFLCHHCGKSFKRHDTLKQHKMIHGESGPTFTCPHCNKVCRSSTQLKEHMTVHTTQRPFLCELCGVTFKTRSNQSKHVKMMHSVVRLIPCPVCKRTFSSKGTMIRHQKTHRSKENNNDVDSSTSKCYILSNSEPSTDDLTEETVNQSCKE
ncbi:uncharacterized protein LOC142322138 isoform X1 [Lycorma delicatula]|uniref:uncharacterized protein LOC142322138 isoform X1 n=1 Tax=Lycorma delicatula TaxID=130591 RepID=UPI003F5158B3